MLGTESLKKKNILHFCSKHAACKNILLDHFTVHIMESLTEKYYCTNVDVKIYGYFDIYKPSLSDYVNLEIFYQSFHRQNSFLYVIMSIAFSVIMKCIC